jgi:acetylornithine deacetylase
MSAKSAKPQSLDMIKRLIAFDTTSRESNLELIWFIRDYLADLGVESRLVPDETGRKANLYATLGPNDRAGFMLSGHTDVVPVDGQPWDTDPFHASLSGGRLYGRGTADMKSFVAIVLTLAPEFLKRDLMVPIHLAFSYDEEVGCIGVRRLIEMLKGEARRPYACIVGEPTSMKPVRAHKGQRSARCHVRGLESHSALTDRGVNAVEAAAEVIAHLKAMARRLRDHGPHDPAFDPPYTTVHTGTIRGGTALNIVPKECSFEFEFRHLPGDDPEALFREIQDYAEKTVLPEMQAVSEATGFDWEALSGIPCLAIDEAAELSQLVKALTGANRTGTVSFGTEAGLFQNADIPTLVCGPGDIAQAHKPNEFIALDQVAECEAFMRRLMDRLCADA